MKLETIATKFQELATKMTAHGPDRDALAEELAALAANPPGYFVDVHAPVVTEHPTCAGCRAAVQEATERRATYMAYGARVDAVRAQLLRLSFGGPAELDAAGRALTVLRADLRRARNEHERHR